MKLDESEKVRYVQKETPQLKKIHSIRRDIQSMLPFAADNKTSLRLREIIQILNSITFGDFKGA
jgi:hypothetical protein